MSAQIATVAPDPRSGEATNGRRADPAPGVPGAIVGGPLTFDVYGPPQPQGSKRVGFHGARSVVLDSNDKALRPWREAVKHAALEVLGDDHEPYDEPLVVEVTYTVAKPASAPRRRLSWPRRKPDLDKLVRGTFDALSDAGLWVDDARVVELTARKCYPDEGLDALRAPGARIAVWRVAEAIA